MVSDRCACRHAAWKGSFTAPTLVLCRQQSICCPVSTFVVSDRASSSTQTLLATARQAHQLTVKADRVDSHAELIRIAHGLWRKCLLVMVGFCLPREKKHLCKKDPIRTSAKKIRTSEKKRSAPQQKRSAPQQKRSVPLWKTHLCKKDPQLSKKDPHLNKKDPYLCGKRTSAKSSAPQQKRFAPQQKRSVKSLNPCLENQHEKYCIKALIIKQPIDSERGSIGAKMTEKTFAECTLGTASERCAGFRCIAKNHSPIFRPSRTAS